MHDCRNISPTSCCWFLLLNLFFLSTLQEAITVQPICLTDHPEVNPKRYLHYAGKSQNITIEVSNRLSHQLSTEIFRIFLQEVLGYPRVEVVHQDDYFDVEDVIQRISIVPFSNRNINVPETMINLEMWTPPELDTISLLASHNVKESGYLAPPGRFGWFIPKKLSAPLWNYDKRLAIDSQEVFYTIFKDSQAVKMFDVDDEVDSKIVTFNSLDPVTKKHFCTASYCTGGMFVPEQCKSKYKHKSSCALLLASHHNVTKFVVEHIKELNLYVKVVWLGDNLKTVMKLLRDNYLKRNSQKSLVVLSWTPSDVVSPEENFISVAFRRCELLNSSVTIGCKYEMMRLLKVAWSKMELYAKPAYESLQRIRFSHEEYDGLLEMFNANSQHKTSTEVACDWMKQSKHIWEQWIPRDTDKPILYIGGIFPILGDTYTAKGIITGAKMATEAVKNSTILRDYNLDLLIIDGQCRADMVMKAFIDFIFHNIYKDLVGVLGPACSDTVEPLAGISKHYNTMIISYSAEGAIYSDRNKYPYFFRTIGENHHYKHVYLQIMQQMGWKRVAALSEDGQKYTEYISRLHDLLQQNGITFIVNKKFPKERDKNAMTIYLQDLKEKSARIIIADMYDEAARSLMCAAYQLDMTAYHGYVWFLPLWLSKDWYNTTHYNKKQNETVNCTTEQMIEAINGYLSMHHAYFAPDTELMEEQITVKEWRRNYESECKSKRISPSNYAGYAYDAIWTYAYALDKLIKDDPEAIGDLHSSNSTHKLLNIIKATDFMGVSGHIKFHGGPSRFSVINIVQWLNTTGTNVVGHFYPVIHESKPEVLNGTLELNMSAIVWLSENGMKPDDGTVYPTKCVVEGVANLLNVGCEMALLIINLLVFAVVGTFLTVGFIIVKKRYDNKVKLTQQYMKSLGIDLLSAANMSSLDKWEIPRESVVINRKLGEGAFGTVYGGEANFPNTGWLAIAVKTLKVGSTTEEKLDFLSEAEVMKRFDHKNIVKLLGVCTKNEPVYTVMEFMLYGDMKTFLLARRHLVNEGKNCEESDEISPKKLTGMALDVARALSYLAQEKYVHRDIASRNCLVNAQRIVKLGDFGMTRPMFENDYYKFNRKGMLPVRWMSPESLALGVFTPASDVWSYGVLLYEIITFGSFPFQGMSNNQVLEYVKAGNTLNIPSGVKPQLEGLIKSCWNQDYKVRPQASEIVEFIANNPRLLSPNLDVPISSVQMEDTGQLELQLPEQFRKCSISMNFATTNTVTTTTAPPRNDIVPNGSALSFDVTTQNNHNHNHIHHQHQNSDGGVVALQLENCGPRDPLLGPSQRSNSLMGLTKYVGLQPNRNSESAFDRDNYINSEQSLAVSKV